MLPPLLLWLACDSIGTASRGRSRRSHVRAFDRHWALVVCLAVVALYMLGYKASRSFAARLIRGSLVHAAGVSEPGGLADGAGPRRFAGLIVLLLVATTSPGSAGSGGDNPTSDPEHSPWSRLFLPCSVQQRRWVFAIVLGSGRRPGQPLYHDDRASVLCPLRRLVDTWLGSSPTSRPRGLVRAVILGSPRISGLAPRRKREACGLYQA